MKIIKENKKNWKLLVRVDKQTGDIVEFAHWSSKGYYSPHLGMKEIENFVFKGDLKYKSFYRGRSAVVFVFEDEQGIELMSTVSGIATLLDNITKGNIKINNNRLTGFFTFMKQGNSFSIVPYEG